jgi:hypothetical protein
MTINIRACKNCTAYTDSHKCTTGTLFDSGQFTTEGERIVTGPFRNSVCPQHEMRKGLPKVLYIRPATCADCFHFSSEETYLEMEDFPGEVFPAGCGYGHEMCISENPLAFRPIQATDQACGEHITEQEVEIEDVRKDEEAATQEKEAESRAELRKAEADADRLTDSLMRRLKGGSK